MAALALTSAGASAQSDVPPALTNGDFDLDIVTGPVLGTRRALGLGGAYTALATGIDGAAWNPASYAAHSYWELDWFAWDLAFDIIPTSFNNTDFDNNGEVALSYENFLFASTGLRLQFGALGLGAVLNIQTFQVGSSQELGLIVGHYGAAYEALAGALVIGVGGRTANLEITEVITLQSLVQFAGTGPEVGVLFRPPSLPLRVGFAARTTVESPQISDPNTFSALALPRRVRLPWEFQAGFAYQLGDRPFNLPWVNPHDRRNAKEKELRERRQAREAEHMAAQAELGQSERDPAWWRAERERRRLEQHDMWTEIEAWQEQRRREIEAKSREYLVLSTEVIVVGPSEDGVGLESFLSQVQQNSGRGATVGIRLGAEGEPIENWLKARAGSYLEPSRFDGVGYRVHGTVGFEVKLFSWDLFGLLDEFTLSIGSSLDVADRYVNLAYGLGFWH